MDAMAANVDPGGTPPTPENVPGGMYRHYKGGHYLVFGLGFDANIDGRTTVIYVPLYLRDDQPGPRLTVRTVEDFCAEIDPHTGALWADTRAAGSPCACTAPTKRFTYLGPTWQPAGEQSGA
jgi:hypothetical protein